MTEERSDFVAADTSTIGWSNGNGMSHADAIGVAEASNEDSEAPAPDAEAQTEGDDAGQESDAATSSFEPTVEATAEVAAVEPEAAGPDDGAGFVSELARAMHETAGAEHDRATQDIDRRRETRIAGIHARRDADATRMRELADDDRKSIEAWVESEQQRIQAERERRISVLEEDLTLSLTQNGATIDREIEGVEAAITAHRTEIEQFFTTLADESDPVRIAQHAARRPVFPALDAVAPAAEIAVEPAADAAAATESAPAAEAAPAAESAPTDETADAAPVVGVMDLEPAPRPAGSWIPPRTETEAEETRAEGGAGAGELVAVQAEGADVSEIDPVSGADPVLATAVAVSAAPSQSMIQSMPISRPMSWLRRDRDQGDH